MSEPSTLTQDATPSTTEVNRGPIMILEDELIIATDLRTRLESMGYTVAGIHTDGEDALEALSHEKPGLILVDIGLHGELDGIEAAKRVRADHDVPVVFITAYGDEATRMRALEVSASAYLLKPIADDEFSGIVRKLLPGVPRIPAPVPRTPPESAEAIVAPAPPVEEAPAPAVEGDVVVAPVVKTAPPALGRSPVSRRPVRPAVSRGPVSATRSRTRRSLRPQWQYVFNTYLPRHHCVLYRDNTLGIQLQVMTKTSGWISRPKSYYFIDGVKGTFSSETKLIRRLHRLLIRRARARLPFWQRLRVTLAPRNITV